MAGVDVAPFGPIVGREDELDRLRAFVKGDSASVQTLVLEGAPGAGKTTLWDAGVGFAGECGIRVLQARPSESEVKLSFAGLADLLADVDLEDLESVPSPQRRALEIALRRIDPEDLPPDEFAVSAGFTSTLRALAERKPLLVAIDDVPWIDRPSADRLVYGARRLRDHSIRFLLARRRGHSTALEQALEPGGIELLDVGALSLGATRSLLLQRLGLTLPRRVLRQVHASGQGNPLFTLELGRSVVESGLPKIGEELPVPERVEAALGMRVARLRGPVRTVLLAVALASDLRAPDFAELGYADAADEAVEAGVLSFDEDRARASHPLLAAAARKHSSSPGRRRLHLQLARIVADEGARVRHLALATPHPDEDLAAAAASAAGGAAVRGAAHEAVELSEHALRLTPEGSSEREDRLLALASHLALAGEPQRLTNLLAPALDSLPRGASRARACLLLSGGDIADDAEAERYLERALAESGNDPGLHAAVIADMANNTAAARVERIAEAEQWAEEAVVGAAQDDVERSALHALAWTRALRGRSIDDLCEHSRASSNAAALLTHVPERVAAQRLVWRGELDRARIAVTGLRSLADERGQAISYALLRLHLCELELRAGRWDSVSTELEEWDDPLERGLLPFPMYERCQALLAAGRGLVDEARRWAADTISRAEQKRIAWDRLEALRAQGIAALLAREPTEAAESLGRVWRHTQREGVEEPGVFPVAPDLVEALVEVGEIDEARAVTKRLRRLSEEQDHPWGLASTTRSEGVIRLVVQRDESALASLAEAAAAYGGLGLRFDRARSLLLLGQEARRLRKWRLSRDALAGAIDAFDEIGSEGWSHQARSALARVGGRRPTQVSALTPSEERVARLAADGFSNKEIAQHLVVTVNTIEAHLTHVYAKLGVRSRVQLAARLSGRS